MSTFKEVIYMIIDEVKGISDDFYYTEEHILYLIDKYRATLLRKFYGKSITPPLHSNYQTIKIEVESLNETNPTAIGYNPNDTYNVYKSKKLIPKVLNNVRPKVYSYPVANTNITYVDFDRFLFTGYNTYLTNIHYCTIDPENTFHIKSRNTTDNITKGEPKEDSGKKVYTMYAIFESAVEAALFNNEDILDLEFPLESQTLPTLVQMVVQEILGASWRPKDESNNASDDLSRIASFVNQMLKKPYKQQTQAANNTEDDEE